MRIVYERNPSEKVDFVMKPTPRDFAKDDVLFFAQGDFSIEDLGAAQMKELLSYREQVKKYKDYLENRVDKYGFLKEYFKMILLTDEKRMTIKISVFRNVPSCPRPREYWLLFNMKKGSVKLSPEFDEIETDFADYDEVEYLKLLGKKFKKSGNMWREHVELRLETFEHIIFDRELLTLAYKSLVKIARDFTGRSLEGLDSNIPEEILLRMYEIALAKGAV